MVDPLSTIASVTAVLTFSIQSCRYIGQFISQVHDAPNEVRKYQLCLQALTATFCELLKICDMKDFVSGIELPCEFSSRLSTCNKDITDMSTRIRRITGGLDGGKMAKAWSRVKYTIFDEQRLESFFERIQIYQATFTLDLIAFIAKMSIYNTKLLSDLASQPKQAFVGRETLSVTLQQPTTVKAPDLGALKCWYRAKSWHTVRLGSFTLIVSKGQTPSQVCGTARPPTSPAPLSAAVRFQLQIKFGAWRGSLSAMLFFEDCALYSGSSLRCLFTHLRVVPRNADIFRYVRRGEVSIVRSLFLMGRASPVDTTQGGLGLLHISCNRNHLMLTRFLLEAGADIHATDNDGRTPLHFAVSNSKDFELCRILLRHGADMGSQDMEGKTPLHTSFNLVTGTVLQQHRNLIVDLDADRNGMTILQFAACSNQSTFEHIHYFLQQQPQLATAPDSNGRLILHFASERGNVALMQYLCNGPSAACINFVDSTGRAPIHHAMRSKRVAAIDLLIARGADAGLVTTHGWTILHEAASRDSIAAIQHVLELLGASAEAMLVMSDLDNRTPLDVARKLNALRVVDYLEKHQGQDSHKSSLEKRAPYLNPRKHYDMIWIVVCVFVGISGLRAIVPFVLQLRSL